jgi:hypothetical protein
VFLPPLLRRSDVAVLSAVNADGAVAGGVVAHRAGKAVGLTNFFARGEAEDEALRAEAVEAAAAAFPGLPLVAWEAGRDLAESRAHGFAPIGPLRVWVRVV